MAGIGLYGVYYSPATLSDGSVVSYTGAKTMGKAISASFEPTEGDQNVLYANNGIAETDGVIAVGGTLSLTLDRLKEAAIADLFNVTAQSYSVTISGTTTTGSGFSFDGSETAAVVGVAFIRQKQEDQVRTHEVIIFGAVTFDYPSEEFETMGESIEWQTPELTGTVTNNLTSLPWKISATFATQAEAEQFIEDTFATP